MKSTLSVLIFSCIFLFNCKSKEPNEREELANKIEQHLRTEVLDKWYPQAMDTMDGGFLSSFTFDFKPTGDQEKMIVTQSRHVWTNAKAALRYPEVDYYKIGAAHGFKFLRDKMWDHEKGGFYWLVDK